MTIFIDCRQCGKQLKAPDSIAGKQARCPRCKAILNVPEQALEVDDLLTPLEVAAPIVPPAQPIALPPTVDSPPSPPEPAAPLFSDDDLAYEVAETPTSTDSERRQCPTCGKWVPKTAEFCGSCGDSLNPALRRSTKKKKKKPARATEYSGHDEEMTAFDYLICLVCPGCACWVSLYLLLQGRPKAGKMLAISFVMVIVVNAALVALNLAFAPHVAPK